MKRANKVRLANLVAERLGIRVDPSALFDIQVKRIHEYKRQLLNIIETVALYDQIRSHPEREWMPRVKFFGGKAAPSYHNAKLIIKLANDVAKVINHDPSVRGLLKVVFIPNYNVSLAEIMMPAADLSEQISTAGMEASGTGNMKFALNGALTIGTLDGANVEMKECVGDDNIVIFGLTAEEVADRRANGYQPRQVIEGSPELSQALSAISSGVFSPDDPNRYRDLLNGALRHRLVHGGRRLRFLHGRPAQGRRHLARQPRTGTPRRSATWRGWAGFPPTARSGNMPATSGMFRMNESGTERIREY